MRIIAVTLATLLVASVVVRAEDWPKWMGPRGDGISRETGLAEKWPESGPKKIWSNEVGIGFSSPVAVEGKIYLMALVGTKDVLYCMDAESGKVLWQQAYEGGYTGDHKGTRATPTIADGKIYTYGGAGQLVCRNLADGQQIWLTNILKETGAGNLTWGVASSPVLYNNRIYVQGGKNGPVAVAVDKETGKIVAKSDTGTGGYATISIVDVDGTKQAIVFGGTTIYGMDPETLKTLWSMPWKTSYDVNAMTPLYKDGLVFLSSDYGRGCTMLKLGASGFEKLFENKEMKAHFQPMIMENGVFYGNNQGELKCMAWPSGEVKWAAKDTALRLRNGGSLVRVGDKLILMSEDGKLSLTKASAAGVELISQVQLFNASPIWATPLIYNGKLYAKGTQELVCLDLTGK